jgi:hypothetical protein
MPFVLFLLGAATVGLIASQASKPKPRGNGTTYTLDKNLPVALRNQVLAALATNSDPTTLLAFAASLDAAGYPLSAAALQQKTAALGGPQALPVPAFPQQPMPSPQQQQPLPSPVSPPAAATPIPVVPTIPSSPPQPAPSAPQAPLPNPFSLDPNMPPSMQSAVLGALTTETDPVKLQAFAQEIQAQFPIAAGLLMAKANALRVVPTSIPTLPITPPPSLPAVVPPPSPLQLPAMPPGSLSALPIGDNSTRTGRNAGRPSGYPFIVLRGEATYPAKIAQQATGSQANYPQMSKLNPQFAKDGVHWINIQKGDALNVPWAWVPKLAPLYLVEVDPGVQPPSSSLPAMSFTNGVNHGNTANA